MGKYRFVSLVLLVFCGGLFFLQVYFDAEAWLEDSKTQKRFEIENSVIVGYDKGELMWEIASDYIWTGTNKYLFNMNKIDSGKLYDSQGRLVLDDIQAEGVKVNSKRKVIIASANVRAVFVRRGENNNENPTRIRAGSLKYFNYSNLAYLRKKVEIHQKDSSVFAHEVVYDKDLNQIEIESPFRVEAEDYVASANRMVVMVDEDYSELKGGVSVFRAAQFGPFEEELDVRERKLRAKNSYVKAGYLKYDEANSDEVIVTIKDQVHLYQDGKSLRGDLGVYDRLENTFSLDGMVVFEADSLKWLVRPNKQGAFQNENLDEALSNEVVVRADQLYVDMDRNYLRMSGNVVLTQDKKILRANQLELDDVEGVIILSGDVLIRNSDSDRIQTERLVLSIDDESFWTETVSGNVGFTEIEFLIEGV